MIELTGAEYGKVAGNAITREVAVIFVVERAITVKGTAKLITTLDEGVAIDTCNLHKSIKDSYWENMVQSHKNI